MIFDSEFQDDHFGSLVIENYPNLEKIVIEKFSLSAVIFLKICNNENLKTIDIKNNICDGVKSVIIESILYFEDFI